VLDGLIEFLLQSDWTYLLLFAIAAGDAFFPIFPSETAAIAAGVVAATDQLTLGWVIAAAGAGAVVGDNIAYVLGRVVGQPAARRLFRRERARRRFEEAGDLLERRGAYLIVIARFIPGGRTAVTFTAGTTRFPWLKFAPLTLVAGAVWASYAALLGYFGGQTFEDNPVYGVLFALGIAAAITLAIEGYRRFVRG
jgi:membrane-associated protein